MEEIRLTQYSKGGGCGCKIAPSVLQQMIHTLPAKTTYPSLLVGNESSDDAAVYLINDQEAVISTTDFFLPIVDDAYDFGRIAAANAISDVYAMGGTPVMAIALLGWPIDKLPLELAVKVMDGGRKICQEAGIPLAGGHTIESSDPIFGLAVTGKVQTRHLKRNNTAREGDLLFITKPIGVGVLSTALKRNLLSTEHYSLLIEQLTTLNTIGEDLGKIEGVHALTDVTGFGLLGHLMEMALGSKLSAELNYSVVNKINGLENYLALKTIPDATFRNWNSYSKNVRFEKGVNVLEAFNILPDPQTNGGLLIAVSEQQLDEVRRCLAAHGLEKFTNPIGRFLKKEDKDIIVIP